MATKDITDYWLEYYCDKQYCDLCGNTGILDTRGAKTPTGLVVGKLNYCICPNGQSMRKQKADLGK